MTKFKISLFVFVVANFLFALSQITYSNIPLPINDDELTNVRGGAASCKITVWEGECGVHPDNCNSGMPSPCVTVPDDTNNDGMIGPGEGYMGCINGGDWQLKEGSQVDNWPSCESREEDGRAYCEDETFYCWFEVKCAIECDIDEITIEHICVNSSFQRTAGRKDTQVEDPASNPCNFSF